MSPTTIPGKMTLRQTWQPMDSDAAAYITAVETADGQALEEKVKIAIDNFVLGCKADGIWSAIKASCILAGARTTNGALVPLVGTAPTPNNFDLVGDTDYNRKTGLKGDGSTKYLDSGLDSGTANSDHVSAYITEGVTSTSRFIGTISGSTGRIEISWSTSSSLLVACQNLGGDQTRSHTRSNGFAGVSSNFSTGALSTRGGGTSVTGGSFSRLVITSRINIFRYSSFYYPGRLAFYSIGEALDLEKLDNRVTRLMNLITYTQTAGLPDLATMDIDAAAYIGGGYRVGGTLS